MASFTQLVILSLIGGTFSLAGGILVLSNKKTAKILAGIATPFSAGALLAAAFSDLLPDALQSSDAEIVLRYAGYGIVVFFLLEHYMHWFHHHDEHNKDSESESIRWLVIIGDTVHNAIDGVAIGVAALSGVGTGIVTAIVVAMHEIPQEIGDFGLMLKYGMSRKKTLVVNLLSSFATLAAAVLVYFIGGTVHFDVGRILGLTAGFFIYIAASDLLPAIHRDSKGRFAKYDVALLVLGLVSVSFVIEFVHHLF